MVGLTAINCAFSVAGLILNSQNTIYYCLWGGFSILVCLYVVIPSSGTTEREICMLCLCEIETTDIIHSLYRVHADCFLLQNFASSRS